MNSMITLTFLLTACLSDAYHLRSQRKYQTSCNISEHLEYAIRGITRLQKNVVTTVRRWLGEIRVANASIIKSTLIEFPHINVTFKPSGRTFLAWLRLRATRPQLLYERSSECDKEWPGGRPPLSTRWPWTVRPSLVILWGVCWMFYPPKQHRNRPTNRPYSRDDDQTPEVLAFAADWVESLPEQTGGQDTTEPVPISQTWQAPAFVVHQVPQLPHSTAGDVPSQYSSLIGQPYSAYAHEYALPVAQGRRNVVIYSHGTPHDFQSYGGQAYSSGTSGHLTGQGYPHTWTPQPLHQGQAAAPLPVSEALFPGYQNFPAFAVPSYSPHVASQLPSQLPPPVLQELPSQGANWEGYLTAATNSPALSAQNMGSPFITPPYPTHRLSVTMADANAYSMSPRVSPRSGRAASVATSLASASSNIDAGSPAASDISRRPSGTMRRDREPPRNDEGDIVCDHPDCQGKDVTFRRASEWNKHMDRHERPYKCIEPGCENMPGFTYSGGLLRHQREVHRMHGSSTRQLFFCPFFDCNRSEGTGFTRRENLEEHKRRRHFGQEIGQLTQRKTGDTSPASASTGSSIAGPSNLKRKRVVSAEEQEESEPRTGGEEVEDEEEDETVKRMRAELQRRGEIIRRQKAELDRRDTEDNRRVAELNQLRHVVRAQHQQMTTTAPTSGPLRPPARPPPSSTG